MRAPRGSIALDGTPIARHSVRSEDKSRVGGLGTLRATFGGLRGASWQRSVTRHCAATGALFKRAARSRRERQLTRYTVIKLKSVAEVAPAAREDTDLRGSQRRRV